MEFAFTIENHFLLRLQYTVYERSGAFRIGSKQQQQQIFISVVCHSPSQTNYEFNKFLLNFEKMLLDINQRKPYLTVVTGEFNARSSS